MVVPGAEAAAQKLHTAGAPVIALDGTVEAKTLETMQGIAVICAAGASDWTQELRIALAQREGAILPLVTDTVAPERFVLERHLCIDTTAAGGNASLLATAE
jgi:RHH-type proline utilization regulon transcriptional repressor/proline dehydrogenase/delta 1-pyrroline-5-carboxylate dehydrogenase